MCFLTVEGIRECREADTPDIGTSWIVMTGRRRQTPGKRETVDKKNKDDRTNIAQKRTPKSLF